MGPVVIIRNTPRTTIYMSPEDLEAKFIKQYVRPKSGRTLIVGSKVYKYRKDRRKDYRNAIGVDQESGPGVDIVADLEAPVLYPALYNLGRFDHIECWSVLEHSKAPWNLANNLEWLLSTRGTIHVQVPFVWRVHSYPSDYWRFTAEAIKLLFPRIYWHKIMYANTKLVEAGKVPMVLKDEHKYFARTEVYAFGELAV